jgi:phosphate transport system substrate-binding protein
MEPLRKEFLKYVLSKNGQLAVIKDGFFPVTSPLAAQDLKAVGIE